MSWRTAPSVVSPLLLALALLAADGCGGEPTTSAPVQPVAAMAEAPPAAGDSVIANPVRDVQLLKPWTGDFDGMVQRRVLRALVVVNKTFYFVENGQPRGSAYETLRAFEDEENRKLRTKNVRFHVLFVPTSRGDVIPALVEGRGDLAAAGFTVTEGRKEKVDFSKPFVSDVRQIAVTGPASPAIATVDDLCGQEILVRRSSSYWEHLEGLNRRFAAEKKAPVKLVEAPEDLEDEDLLEMLNAGAFGIAVVNEPIATLWAKVLTDIHPHTDVVVHSGGEIAWMFRKNSPELRAELDPFVTTHAKGTAFGNTIIKRYSGSTTFIKRSTSPEEIAKFQNLVTTFKQYGSKYDVDYLLAMAQGFQESRLDQSAKSAVGAIGVMQVMPATGKDLEVGDIHQVEPNIHAGVKYIRWMIDHYYKDEPMTPLNKGLFAFAAYNCGPSRVAQLRKEAKARGLDPNRWINNVELVAADRIGPETVTYVSNIYKYYIAYELVTAREEARAAVKATLANR